MKIKIILALMVAALMVACNDDDSPKSTARFELRLTDAPALYDSVMIEVEDIYIKMEGMNYEIELDELVDDHINLLELTNGIDTLLAGQDIPAGRISQIRLVLDDDNYVVVNGVKHQLVTPSAQQSGLKLNVQADLAAGITYRMWIDFDASRSIVANPNKYILKPVIRTFTEATSGVVTGTVLPASAKAYVMGVSKDLADTTSAYADEVTGKFLLRMLKESDYTITIQANGFKTVTRTEAVELGKSKDLGTINLTPAL